jgi:hypothetical protein
LWQIIFQDKKASFIGLFAVSTTPFARHFPLYPLFFSIIQLLFIRLRRQKNDGNGWYDIAALPRAWIVGFFHKTSGIKPLKIDQTVAIIIVWGRVRGIFFMR